MKLDGIYGMHALMQVSATRLTTVRTKERQLPVSRRPKKYHPTCSSSDDDLSVEQKFSLMVAQLAQRRMEMGISQIELSDQIGIAHGLVGKWESGARFPSRHLLFCWITALNMKLDITENGKIQQGQGRQSRTRDRYKFQRIRAPR